MTATASFVIIEEDPAKTGTIKIYFRQNRFEKEAQSQKKGKLCTNYRHVWQFMIPNINKLSCVNMLHATGGVCIPMQRTSMHRIGWVFSTEWGESFVIKIRANFLWILSSRSYVWKPTSWGCEIPWMARSASKDEGRGLHKEKVRKKTTYLVSFHINLNEAVESWWKKPNHLSPETDSLIFSHHRHHHLSSGTFSPSFKFMSRC